MLLRNNLTADELIPFQDFIDMAEKYEALRGSDKESFGTRIREADERADKAWSAIRTQLELNVTHYDIEVKRAAEQVQTIFNTIQNPTHLSYDEEYIELKKLVTKLLSLDSNVLEKAWVLGWINELNQRVNEFESLRQEQKDAKDNIELGLMKKTREQLTTSYQELIETINVLLRLKHSSGLETFATQLEQFNDEERAKEKSQATKEDKDKAKEAEKGKIE